MISEDGKSIYSSSCANKRRDRDSEKEEGEEEDGNSSAESFSSSSSSSFSSHKASGDNSGISSGLDEHGVFDDDIDSSAKVHAQRNDIWAFVITSNDGLGDIGDGDRQAMHDGLLLRAEDEHG
jgi:hypothetical protein